MILLLLRKRTGAAVVVSSPCRDLSATPIYATVLVPSVVISFAGFFPGEFPGPTSYPGRGTTLSASTVPARVLQATETC